MKKLSLLTVALMASPAFAATWTTTYDSSTGGGGYYDGVNATVVFNDWGYTGPSGANANTFQIGAGFDASRIGQIQTVVTKDPDWATSDPVWNSGMNPSRTNRVVADDGSGAFQNASMDAQVNFYRWGYTTVGGSTFNNMTIDKAGNYFVARNDMNFQFYDTFMYKNVSTGTVTDYDTAINFQPYAVSDARGWCGSVLQSNPNGLSQMAGQVTFDFAFDAYLGNTHPGPGASYATQIVPDFVMRSYGDYNITVTGAETFNYVGSAVANNTDPVTGALDPAYLNQVSFLGGGVVPKGVWVFGDGTPGVTVADVQGAAGTVNGQVRADGATWHQNSFAGYAFLLRADGTRTLTFIAPDGHSDYVTTDPAAYASLTPVPEPETYAMMLVGVGLVGGAAWRRKRAA